MYSVTMSNKDGHGFISFFFLLLFILFFPLCFTSPLCPVFTELGKVNTDAVPIADSSSWRLSWLNCTFVDTVILRKLTAVKRWSAHALVYNSNIVGSCLSPELPLNLFFFFLHVFEPRGQRRYHASWLFHNTDNHILERGFPMSPIGYLLTVTKGYCSLPVAQQTANASSLCF